MKIDVTRTTHTNLDPGYMLSRERLTKIQAVTIPDYLWPEMWIGTAKAAKKQKKQEWALE